MASNGAYNVNINTPKETTMTDRTTCKSKIEDCVYMILTLIVFAAIGAMMAY